MGQVFSNLIGNCDCTSTQKEADESKTDIKQDFNIKNNYQNIILLKENIKLLEDEIRELKKINRDFERTFTNVSLALNEIKIDLKMLNNNFNTYILSSR
jgi:hypothetical protein